MLVCFKFVCRAIGVLLGAWLLLVSFCMGLTAYELNDQRVSQGCDGPTMMWISFGGETVSELEPKVSHILAHAGIAVFSAALGGA